MKTTENDQTLAHQSDATGTASGLWRKVIFFPLTRLVIALIFVAAAFIGRDVVANGVLSLSPDAAASRAIVTMLAVSLAYILYVRLVERRSVLELDVRHAPRELAIGIGVGAAFMAIVVGILALLGYYRISDFGGWNILTVALAPIAATAVWEEIAFRGIVFRIMEEGLGTWFALIVSAAAFGLLHSGNENASLLGILTITLVAGVFLAGVYVLTRRLWVAIGVHYAVNLTQGPIFGLPVSGRERQGVLEGQLSGPDWLTGGTFGVEASLITAVLGSAMAFYVVRTAYVQHRFMGPLWAQSRSKALGGITPELSQGREGRSHTLPLEEV